MSGIQMALLGSGRKLVKQVAIITAGTSVTLPSSWNPANNTIEVIGGGQGGQDGRTNSGGIGGIGGSYAKIINFGSPSNSYTISIGHGSSDAASKISAGNTWFSNTGSAPTSTTQGVLAAGGGQIQSSIGIITFNGGSGGSGGTGSLVGGGGGGGAAGPNSNGNNGSNATGDGGAGGQGDGTFGGAGGATDTGGGPYIGSAGSEWTVSNTSISGTGLSLLPVASTAGSGGGGGGGSGTAGDSGGIGGNYGAGGGGGSWNNIDVTSYPGASGTNGLIVLTWYA